MVTNLQTCKAIRQDQDKLYLICCFYNVFLLLSLSFFLLHFISYSIVKETRARKINYAENHCITSKEIHIKRAVK